MTSPFRHITARCFVNVPFDRLRKDLRRIIDNRIQPEIGFDGDILHSRGMREFKETAAALKGEGLPCTIHAPFTDLAPGSSDSSVLHATRHKLHRAFQLVEIFSPVTIVCHLNYEAHKQKNRQRQWLDISLETWRLLLETIHAQETLLMFENTYETDPDMHQRMFTALASPRARFCLDTGHLLAFAHTPWQNWLPALQPWLGQLHLHDNHGHEDEHLAVGQGNFDFPGFFAYLQSGHLQPIITLEPHREEYLWESLAYLDTLPYFSSAAGRAGPEE
jgi:sugar phosphate isomerase/epimerase